MSEKKQIESYLTSLSPPKDQELRLLHQQIVIQNNSSKIWFFDGKNETGKQVSNPNIGYGEFEIKYANGKTRNFFRVGISANTSGISVYIMGLEDKKYLNNTYKDRLGKASITGYCIKFKGLSEINLNVLLEIIKERMQLV